MNFRNVFRKNQMIVYAMALMLVVAGYFNYTANVGGNEVETSVKEVKKEEIEEVATNENVASSEEKNDKLTNKKDNETALVSNEQDGEKNSENQIAEIGDATLVNSNDVVEDNYFAKSKIERNAMYSQMLETYQTILNSPNSLQAQKEKASIEMAKINETKNSIMICENLLETKGFKHCVIFVNDGSVSVIVEGKELKSDQTAQIQNIITRELGAIIENIHISVK